MKKKPTHSIELVVNGELKKAEVSPGETLLHTLRETLGHTEVKEGCGKGNCGVCAVLLDGKAVNACLTLALQAHGKEVMTVKGVGSRETPHPLQVSFVKYGAIQCGFCTAGMIISAKALLDKNPRPTRLQIKEAISGNLCRCTGYKKILEAIEDAAEKMKAREAKG